MSAARTSLADGDTWTDQAARSMMIVLIERALQGRRISYGEMRDELHRRDGLSRAHATTYGRPAGKVGDVLIELSKEWNHRIPPLNAILVRQDTGLPGHGVNYYLNHFVNKPKGYKLTQAERDALAESTIQKVFDFPRLREVASYFDVRQSKSPDYPEPTEPIPPPPRTTYGRGGESDEHKALKQWVAEHPERFRAYGKFNAGTLEYYLDSGDEIDVLFKSSRAWFGVEVKTADAPEGELWRGVFQCVKYRALLRATAVSRSEIPNVSVLLVLEKDPSNRIRELADRLDIDWLNVGLSGRR